MIIKHREGKHIASFFNTVYVFFNSLFKRNIILKFTEESKYFLDNKNKLNWNKIVGKGGLIYSCKKKRKNEVFLVWRYNRDKDIFEIAEYYRENFTFFFHIVKTVKINEKYSFNINFLRGIIPLTPWFGGSKPSPKDVKYSLNFSN